jgi:hypothetical protein
MIELGECGWFLNPALFLVIELNRIHGRIAPGYQWWNLIAYVKMQMPTFTNVLWQRAPMIC